jgi:hypothetical protein
MNSDDDDDEFCLVLDSEGRVDGTAGACETSVEVWDDWLRGGSEVLRSAAHAAAWPLAAGSFWLPADATPRCELEQLAASVMRFHASKEALAREIAGAEWWANVTRSETVSRAEGAYGDIAMHWDKDERAHASLGLFVQPLLSTVTYLTDAGAPTIVLPGVRPTAEGGYGAAPALHAEVVPPRTGRHLRFDGRWLHGAPAALNAGGEAPYERITFCVNVWLGHKVLHSMAWHSIA